MKVKELDVVLMHPPSVTYFRKKPFLPGPLHRTVPIYTPLFIMFPIGMVSMASYLEEKGLKVKVINLAEKMLVERSINLESFLRKIKSRIYGIGLHWIVHSQGAIEVARLCKSLHPSSIVVLGGLTATYFANEIVRRFDFIDCVIRGEGERPLYELAINTKKIGKFEAFSKTPNLTFKARDGKIISTKTCRVINSLDQLNFTRLDLVEPHTRTITSPLTGAKLWNLPFYRGCMLNCATCGGSRYAYSKLMKRNRIAYRSPERLLEDFMILDEMGIKSIFLFQDPRFCGRAYLDKLSNVFKGVRWSNIRNVGIELFFPASRDYLERIKSYKIAENIGLSISPESASDDVRCAHGRMYTTGELLKTVHKAIELNLPIGVFFMLTLGLENKDSLRRMFLLWKKLLSLNKSGIGSRNVSVDFGPMLLLDPGSLAFDNPEKYGYRLIFKDFVSHYNAMNLPHWSLWFNYETKNFGRSKLSRIVLDSWEALVKMKWRLGLMTEKEMELEIFIVNFERAALQDIEEKSSKSIEELQELAAEVIEISKDRVLSWNYILTHNLNDKVILFRELFEE